jgi:3'-5' exoribonuclease
VVKVYVKDIKEKDQIQSVFQVARKTLTVAKSGKPYLAVVLRDKTGELDARIWTRTEEFESLFAKGDYVAVEGPVTIFQGRPQLRIDSIQKIAPDGLELADFAVPPRTEPGERYFGQVVEIVERIHDPYVKQLLRSFLDDEVVAGEFKCAPAAKSIHHAYPGGLAEHTLSVMKLAVRIADQYPMADRDLLVAGAFLHDIGKIRELTLERQTEYTDEGRFIGHLVIASQLIAERASKIEEFPKDLQIHLMHLVLSHHGTLEFGSARLPQTIEAMLLHSIDEMDSRISSWLEAMKRDSGDTWTDYQKLYDRHLYKGTSPTINAKTPVERRRKKEKPRKERSEAENSMSRPVTQTQEIVASESSSENVAQKTVLEKESSVPERHSAKKPEEKLTFKPFAALVAISETATKAEQTKEETAQVATKTSHVTEDDSAIIAESSEA